MVGFYLYVESSLTRPGQRAELVSPWTPARRGGQCLKFYYTMYGSTMGSLAIKLQLSNGKNWLIFYKHGNQGKGWKKGMGNINVPLGLSYKVRTVVAMRSENPLSSFLGITHKKVSLRFRLMIHRIASWTKGYRHIWWPILTAHFFCTLIRLRWIHWVTSNYVTLTTSAKLLAIVRYFQVVRTDW